MKQLIIFIFLSFIFKPDFAQNIAVACDKNNVLYANVENPLSIAVENISNDVLIVKASKGNVIGKAGKYIYVGTDPGMVDIIIYKKDGRNLKEIGRSPFRVKFIPLPDPTARVGSRSGGKIDKKTMIAIGGVRAPFENTDFSAVARVDSFTVCILYKVDCDYKSFNNIGSKFSEQIVDALQSLHDGDQVIIKSIYATWGISKELIPLLFTIVDQRRNSTSIESVSAK